MSTVANDVVESADSVSSGPSSLIREEATSIRPPASMNGIFGRPGIRHRVRAANPAIRSGVRVRVIWRMMSVPMSLSPVARVTIRPVATESSSAGIWETRPSPTESRLYVVTASPNGMPSCPTPIANPPIRLTRVMMIAAIASPLTNFDAPSIAP